MQRTGSINQNIAAKLREAADVLEQQAANPFRVNAYRRAADTVSGLGEDVSLLLERGGRAELEALPNIGKGIAAAIEEILHTGRWSQLERMRGTLDPEKLLQTVPGIGPVLARKIHDTLHVDTLEQLEIAAHDGRLAQVSGVGGRRAVSIAATLDTLLGRVRGRGQPPQNNLTQPAVTVLLDVDREYTSKAAADELPKIAPKRFNVESKAWLPILHTQRDDWHFTVLFSNTARAHELKRTHDWVVVYFYDDHHQEGQCTIVTETRGMLTGKRVVRGREAECREYYKAEIEK